MLNFFISNKKKYLKIIFDRWRKICFYLKGLQNWIKNTFHLKIAVFRQ